MTEAQTKAGRAAGTLTTSRRRFFAALAGAGVLAAGLTGLAAGAAHAEPKIGQTAPDFTGVDSKGKSHTLSALKGKTVVLEWSNNGCPYVGKHYDSGNMQAMQAEATAKGVVWLTIYSSAPGMQGHLNELEAERLVDERKSRQTALILDPKGAIGRLYEARTTPHMFVVAPDGKLAYAGAIDDKPTANPADVKGARNYVREALDAVAAGQPVKVAQTRAYGCSVKFAEPPRS